MPVGIRELKNHLSEYMRRVEAGETVQVSVHGRVVAELAPAGRKVSVSRRFDQLVRTGAIRPPQENGDPFEGWKGLGLPKGTAAKLIDWDRDED